jgi:hypothetical protein
VDEPCLACQGQERGLEDVLDIVLAGQNATTDLENQRTVAVHQFEEGILIPVNRKSPEQDRIGHSFGHQAPYLRTFLASSEHYAE